MKLLYPDPRRRRPRFEYPGSAGAGPWQLSSTGHLHVAIPRLCWVSLLGLFRAAQGPSGSCRRHSPRSGVSLLPLMVQPPIFLLPPSPPPLHPPAGLLLPRPWLLLDTGPFPQRLLYEASSDCSSRITWPRCTWVGGSFQGLEGRAPSQRLAPTSTHQDPLRDLRWVWGMFAWGHQTLVGSMRTRSKPS